MRVEELWDGFSRGYLLFVGVEGVIMLGFLGLVMYSILGELLVLGNKTLAKEKFLSAW